MIAAWLYIIVANLTSVDSTGAGEILCYPEWWFRDVQMCRVGCSTISRLNKLSFSDFIIFSSSNLHSSHTRLTAIFPVLLRGWAGTRKVKTNLDFTEARDSDISWAICMSAPRSRQITTPAPHHSVFYRPDAFLPPNQQHQSTEGEDTHVHTIPVQLLSVFFV